MLYINQIPNIISISMIVRWTSPTSFMLLYLGPQTILPVASIIAAVVGFVLLFWRLILRFIKKVFKFIRRGPDLTTQVEPEAVEPSHDPRDETQV
jgi:hypothetical protein